MHLDTARTPQSKLSLLPASPPRSANLGPLIITLGPQLHPTPASVMFHPRPPAPGLAACQARDDDVEHVDDAVDDGFENVADAGDDGS
jgi:hypothetical protein